MNTPTKGAIRPNESRVSVSESALIRRIKRTLQKEGKSLHKMRENSRWFNDYGPWYIVDDRNHIIDGKRGLEELGRELGILKNGEVLS